MKALHYPSIAEIAESVRTKKLSPVEIVHEHLERIEEVQPKLNAFVHLDAEGARAQARRAEDTVRRGAELGSLHGVPLTVKSCIDVAGWNCPAGSLLRKDYRSRGDRLWMLGRRCRQRRRRVDSRAGAFLRDMRAEADARKNSGDWAFSCRRRRLFLDRRCWTDGADDCRRSRSL